MSPTFNGPVADFIATVAARSTAASGLRFRVIGFRVQGLRFGV
jgi:hypothetical protein